MTPSDLPAALPDAWQEQYWQQGFVLLPRLLPRDALRRYERRFEDLVLERIPRPEHMVVMEDVMVVKGEVTPHSRLHAVNKMLSFEDDPVLFEYALDAGLLGAVRSLIGDDLITLSSNFFNKPPGVDGRHPFHQDLRYFAIRPADKIVASWTALDRCTRQNGCLAVLPGSHKGPLLKHGSPDWEHVNFGFFAADEVDREGRVHVAMEPGDTLLFHPLLIHGSGHNQSNSFRRAISVHYASAQCERPDLPRKRQPVIKAIPMENP